MLFRSWPSVVDDGPTSKQHWLNVACLLSWDTFISRKSLGITIFYVIPKYFCLDYTLFSWFTGATNPVCEKHTSRTECANVHPNTMITMT